MAIITTDDFNSGSVRIPRNPNQSIDLSEMIDYVEEYYLPRLFGVELYELFIADLVGGVPVTPRFVFVFDPFNDQTNDYFVQSEGIQEMLKDFVYYHYGREQQTRLTTVGAKQVNSENSENRSSIQHDLLQRYNNGMNSYKVIQEYMANINPDDYPEFNGVYLRFNHPF